MDDESYEFEIQKQNPKMMVIKLANAKDLDTDRKTLTKQFQQLRKTFQKTIETQFDLKHGRKKDFFLKAKVDDCCLEVHVSDPKTQQIILNWFVQQDLLEAKQVQKDIISCPIL